eukprot:c24828_g1_i1 orf=436-3072(-)
MAASESSCNSRNLVSDGPVLALGGRMGRGTVHESHASPSNGSNTVPATALKSHSILQANAAVAIKVNSTLPRNASSTSVLQSSWIQRLKPFSQTYVSEEETANFSMKESPVCTHFTKDFKSCSRRLDKTSHHTRSSSWSPHGAGFEGAGHTSMLGEPADNTEGYDKAVVNPPVFYHQSICFPSKNITHNSDAGSGTGNLFAQQQNVSKQVSALEGFEPHARDRGTASLEKFKDLKNSKNGDDNEPKHHLAQQFHNQIKHVKNVDSGAACDVSQQVKPFSQPEEVCNKRDYYYGASAAAKGDVCSQVLSVSAYWVPHSSGASADTDDRNFFAKPLDLCIGNKQEPLQASRSRPDCEIAFPIDKFGENWPLRREGARNGLVMGTKNAGDLGGRNFNQFKELAAKPYYLSGTSNVGASSKVHLSQRNCHMADTFNRVYEGDVITACAVDSCTGPTSATLKQDIVHKKLDAFSQRQNNLAELQNPHFSEGGQTSRSSFPVEDAARSRFWGRSLGEYSDSRVRLLEEPDIVKPGETGCSTASLHQDLVVDEYHKNLLLPPSSKIRLDARQKFEDYHSCSPHKIAEDGADSPGSYKFPLKSSSNNYKFSDHRMSSSQTKTGWGQEHGASADQISHFRLKCQQESQELERCFYKGATGRVDSQTHNEDSDLHTRVLNNGRSHSRMHSSHPLHEFCNNERTGRGCSMHRMWIQRWHSSAKFSGMSGRASAFIPNLSRNSSSEQLVKLPESCSGSAQCTQASRHKAMGSLDLNMADSGRGSNRCTEASGTLLDSCSASTPAYGNFAAFRSGYTGTCIKAMSVVGRSASRLHPPTSLQNRGFCGLPCTSPKSLKCKVLPEDVQGTNDKKMHIVVLGNSKALKHHTDES